MENQEEEENQFLRTQWLLGEAAMERLKKARVAVFGIGGVGGYVAEALKNMLLSSGHPGPL